MILTKEQIQQIDQALIQLGVAYIDIRLEMADHVATALEAMEGNFSYNFKHYMHLHKKELKDNYYRLLFKSRLRVFKLLVRTMVTLPNIVLTATVYAVLMVSLHYAAPQEIIRTLRMVYSLPLAVPLLYYLYSNVFARRLRYSGLDRINYGTSGLAFLLIIPIDMMHRLPNPWLLMLYYAIAAGFAAALLRTFFTVKKQYTVQYHG